MAIKPETLKYFDYATSILDEHDESQKKIAPKLKDLDAKVRADAKLDEPKMGEVHKAALGKLIQDIDKQSLQVRGAKSAVGNVLKDEEFLDEKLAEIEALKKRQEDASELLLAQYKQAKELENLAEENIKKDAEDADELFNQIQIYESGCAGARKQTEKILDEVADIRGNAQKAVRARDAAALAESQKKAAAVDASDFEGFQDMFKSAMTWLKGDAAEASKKDPKAQAQLKDSISDIEKCAGEVATTARVIESFKTAVKGMKINPIDLNKAMKVLGLPSGAKDKLAKVLKGPAADFEDGFNDLVKTLKLKDTTGKKMREQLEKANVI